VRKLRLIPASRSAHYLKGTIMDWETPSFEEIDMSAEIGSYQGEDDNGL
jgi:coenzyme PQQ precursor peptide PqqA